MSDSADGAAGCTGEASEVEREVVGRMYAALAKGDALAIAALMHQDCVVRTAPGLPFVGGRTAIGPGQALTSIWGAIDRHFRVTPEVETCTAGPAGAVVAIGVYRGESRVSRRSFEAWFAHHWVVNNEKIVALTQITDTAMWIGALEPLQHHLEPFASLDPLPSTCQVATGEDPPP